jgi:hypothetical protein
MPTKQSSIATIVFAVLALAALVQPAWAENTASPPTHVLAWGR